MSANDGGPAFPIIGGTADYHYGMTLRDYFAAKAMQGLIASHEEGYWWKCNTYTMGAKYSYRFADAMLKAREL